MEAVVVFSKDNVNKGSKTNTFIAAFITCHAGLKLHETLNVLQEQVLYYDTDSVIYRWQPGLHTIPTCGYLGDMTDELDGGIITEFVSGGPKNYGYLTRGGKIEFKVRGLLPMSVDRRG